jgi:hypothetical protein
VRTSVDGPARSGAGMGLPLPRMTTCTNTLLGLDGTADGAAFFWQSL